MSVTSINTEDGTTATIDSKLFTGYNQEAMGVLDKMAGTSAEYKMLVETVAETTGLKKNIVSKYFKSRFAEKTKEAKALGDVFDTLDGILE